MEKLIFQYIIPFQYDLKIMKFTKNENKTFDYKANIDLIIFIIFKNLSFKNNLKTFQNINIFIRNFKNQKGKDGKFLLNLLK